MGEGVGDRERVAVRRARELLDAANRDPRSAIAAATAFLAEVAQVPAAEAIAHRARGLARAKTGELDGAVADLRAAVDAAGRAGDRQVRGEVAMTLGGVLSFRGNVEGALVAISEAVDTLEGSALARARVQRAAILYRHGDLATALADLDAALPVLTTADDTAWTANLHSNRGIVLGMKGDAAAAERELLAARRLYQELDQASAAAEALQNLGWVATIAGDLPLALRSLDHAEREFVAQGHSLGEVWGDRCDALMLAHLTGEAKELAARATSSLRKARLDAGYAEAELRLARASLMDGDHAGAVAAAERAERGFVDQGRPPWVAQARYLAIQARVAGGEVGDGALAEVEAIAAELARVGFVAQATHAHLLAARLAVVAGELETAATLLAKVRRATRTGPIDVRVDAWLSVATLRRARGNTRGADAAARAGLRVVDDYQATLGASEMRVHVASHAAELSRLGLGLAHTAGRPDRVWRWMERTRAGALRFAPAQPPEDEALAADLAALRSVESDIRAAQLDGHSAADLQRRRDRLQEEVRRRSRAVAADGNGGAVIPGLDAVRERLAGRTLLEIGRHQGRFHAVVITAERLRLVPLGEETAVSAALDTVRFGLSRLSQRRGSAAAREAAQAMADAGCAELDRLLVDGLVDDVPGVVVVPPAVLHAVPWGLLPSLRRAPVTVAPSASVWFDRAGKPVRRRRGVVVANGPDLPGAAAETRRIAALYRQPTRLTARQSTVDALSATLDGARLAHIVAHGSFRGDNPLFSSLRLADGGLTVYDLERIDRMPPLMVLSACNSGLQAVRPGNETMGIVAALLAAGCRTVVASTGLVPDTDRTAHTMVEFHRGVAGGVAPAVALAAAQRRAIDSGPDGLAAAPFVCFGAG